MAADGDQPGPPETLKVVARVTAIDGSLLGLTAWGLWLAKPWGEPFFIPLVTLRV